MLQTQYPRGLQALLSLNLRTRFRDDPYFLTLRGRGLEPFQNNPAWPEPDPSPRSVSTRVLLVAFTPVQSHTTSFDRRERMTAQISEKLTCEGRQPSICSEPLNDYFALAGICPGITPK